MIIQLLIVKSYKGHSVTSQKDLASRLGFVQTGNLLHEIEVHALDEVKHVEGSIRGKVPYVKINRSPK